MAVRLGGYVPSIDSLLYLRAGVAFVDNKFSSDGLYEKKEFDRKVKTPVVMPVVGVGFEKKIFQGSKFNCALRVEGDRRFQVKKNATIERSGEQYKAKVSSEIGSNTIRMLLVCRIKGN